MSSYTSSPIVAISGSGIKNNSGTVMNGGATGVRWNPTSLKSNCVTRFNQTGLAYASWNTGISALLQSTGNALTNPPVQSSTTGYVKLPINSHGFSVGQIVIVIGTDVVKYNQIHRVTAVLDSNNVQTDVPYISDATVAGTYKTVSGNFNMQVKNQYVATIVNTQVAGQASSILRIPGAEFFRTPYPVARGNQRYGISSWDYVTGRATFNGNRGANLNYHDIAGNNDNLALEPMPTRAVPGHLVYFYSAKDQATIAYYKQRNE